MTSFAEAEKTKILANILSIRILKNASTGYNKEIEVSRNDVSIVFFYSLASNRSFIVESAMMKEQR